MGPDLEVAALPEATATAVSKLFHDCNRPLVGYLTARLGSEQEAKEVAQEAYVRLLQRHGTADAGLLRAYLFKTATNLAIDRLRHRQVQQRAGEQQAIFGNLNADGSGDPAGQLLAREQADQLVGYLLELPEKCQRVFSLHRLDGMPQREVARCLGLSERMVRRYVTYAMVYCHLRSEGMTADRVRQKVSL